MLLQILHSRPQNELEQCIVGKAGFRLSLRRSVFSLSNRRKQVSDLTSACRGVRFPEKKNQNPYFNPLIVDATLVPDVPENSAHLPREPSRLKHLCCSTANIKINQAFLPVPPSGSSAYIYFSPHDPGGGSGEPGAGGASHWVEILQSVSSCSSPSPPERDELSHDAWRRC